MIEFTACSYVQFFIISDELKRSLVHIWCYWSAVDACFTSCDLVHCLLILVHVFFLASKFGVFC